MVEAVHAAGGAVLRPGRQGAEICLVHRPRYQDWSLPKGKLDHGEHPLLGAVREVREETGWQARPQIRLRTVDYLLIDGTPKSVEFWLMAAVAEDGVHDVHEVDEVAWLPLPEAAARLTYPDDRAIVEQVAGLPPITAAAAVVRHARAGERKQWSGKDALRPLDPVGQAQAERLASLCLLLVPERLIAATPLRCKQTLEPLSAAIDRPIVLDSAFTEPADEAEAPARAKLAAQRILDLRGTGGLAVVCSQGKVMPWMLAALRDEDDPAPYKTAKGGGWLLTWSGDRLLGLSPL